MSSLRNSYWKTRKYAKGGVVWGGE